MVSCVAWAAAVGATERRPVGGIDAEDGPACEAWQKVLAGSRGVEGLSRTSDAATALLDAVANDVGTDKPEEDASE